METLKKQVTTKKTLKDADGNVTSVKEKKVTAGGVTAERLTKQLEKLQAVSDVYRVRKLIVTNPYYRTHYNEELSMNASENATPEQKYLSKLLRTSFYLGKNLQKLGSADVDINDASSRLLAEGKFSENAESKICRISSDAADYENTAELMQAAKTLRGKEYDKKVKEINKKLSEERRANTEALLLELEHERFTMPEEDVKFDLKTIGSKKVNKKNFIISNPSTTKNLYVARKEKTKREDTADENSLRSRVDKLMEIKDVKAKSIGVQSRRLGNHTGGDTLARQTKNFTGQFVENMTDEEVLEMVEGLTYSLRMNEEDRTPEQQRMAEDMYVQSYLTYTNTVHQAMKKIMNTLGDNITTLHTEDWARLMSNPRFANMLVIQGAISSNMERHLPYEFLKKYSGKNVEYLKDFYMLTKAVSGLTFIADGLRDAVATYYESDSWEEERTAIREEATQKLEEVKNEIKKKKDSGVPEDSPEMRSLRRQEEEWLGVQDSPKLIIMEREMKNIEGYRKKQITDANEENEGNVYELNKENFSETLGHMGYREIEMLKNSSYWDYGKTSEKEKQDYKNSLKSKGVPECYDMEVVKNSVLDRTGEVFNGLAQVITEARKLGVDTDIVEENMEAFAKSYKSMGFTNDELSKTLSELYRSNANLNENDRRALTGDKEKDKSKEDNIAFRGEVMRLLDDMAERLNIQLNK